MATRKRKTKSGISWAYYFDLPGSTRGNRQTVTESGFRTKKAAEDAESQRRIDENSAADARARGVTKELPKTLGDLLKEFCSAYADKSLAVKTAHRYRQYLTYLSKGLLDAKVPEINALHFTREWNRLRESGGHRRGSRDPRPLSAKTVRDIAGFVSSAFKEAIAWGVAQFNPVTNSKKPKGPATRKAVALSPDQQRLLIDSSTHWVLPAILEVCAGLGARRGEVLASRWADVQGDQMKIGRSLSQAGTILIFKEPKTPAGWRTVTIPASTLAIIAEQRVRQLELRKQYGADYQADLDLIFCDPGGAPLKPDSISATASNLCRKLKLPRGVSLHALRHTHGSQLLSAGMELPAVSARLGHSSPAITAKVYSHMLGGRDRIAAEVWDEFQKTAPGQHHAKTAVKMPPDDNTERTQNERVKPN